MSKVKKNNTTRNIDSNIEKMFLVIDEYLPVSYTDEVMKKVPGETANNIRVVKSTRKGKLTIIKALYQVALETQQLLTL